MIHKLHKKYTKYTTKTTVTPKIQELNTSLLVKCFLLIKYVDISYKILYIVTYDE